MAIQPLPDDVIALMNAGEVIDSLAAAVRELVENALDAQATRIVVSICPQRWQICVADNGAGIRRSDLQLAATPHTTSKIQSTLDLGNIRSLGFRGEALHSLCQLADLEILSRSPNSPEGWRVVYDHQGEPCQTELVAIAPGTIVTATNLFGDWETRRQGLPSPAQQLRAVQNTIHHLALCHPWVTWQVQQTDRPWFAIAPADSAAQILTQILRTVQLADLQTLTIEIPNGQELGDTETRRQRDTESLNQEFSPSLRPLLPALSSLSASPSPPLSASPSPTSPPLTTQISLVLGLPDRCHRHRPDWVKVAVNRRMVKLPELEQTILGTLRRTLPRDRFPICFVHLLLPPSQVDWHRCPTKSEVYLQDLEQWQARVAAAIAEALSLRSGSLPEAVQTQRVGRLLKAAEAKGGYYSTRQVQPVAPNQHLFGDSTRSAPLPDLKAIAQVRHTYILAEHSAGMWLVEQHIAHERVLYEQLCDRWHLVHLETPVILSQLSVVQLEQLHRIGLEVELFGDQLWAVRTAPEILVNREDCSEALWELSQGGDLQTAQVATACRSAIRNGTPLTLNEMQTLLEQWQRTQNPRTCPHGRPIYLSLEESSLSRFFRRHWVIGKSHGI